MSNETNAATTGNAFQNPALLNALQDKLGSLVGRPSGYLDSLPPDVKRRMNALKNLQDKHTKIEAEFREEVLALEKKYLLKYQPLYDQRSEIITGTVEPSDEQCERAPDSDEEADEEDKKESEEKTEKEAEKSTIEPSGLKGIPEFWLTAFKNHPQIAEMITEKDEEVLKSLQDIKVSYLNDNPGFKLDFVFGENEYFTDSVLTKTYFLENSPDAAYGDVMYDHASGSDIHWKEGKDLSVTVEVKKQRHKGTNKVRVVKKTVPAETFFHFFNPPKAPEEDEDADDEELDDLDQKLEADYEIGETIKEKLIPRAIDWFTGKALDYEDEDYEDEEGMDGWYPGDDDEDDDEDGSEAEDDEGPGGANAVASTEKPPECKQQ
ncbi:hypothetical protein DFJ77DRAFT_455955 [Powellomyces hirtus]|nr:hypothetical protein DFJ77DRAFT_455955 [Powellomyces hirtus]